MKNDKNLSTMKKVLLTYVFVNGTKMTQLVKTDGSKSTIQNMVDNGDFIDFDITSLPDISHTDWYIVEA